MSKLPRQLSVKQASEEYGIPEWTLRKYIQRRMFCFRRVGRKIYIPTDKFISWLESHDVEPLRDVNGKIVSRIPRQLSNKDKKQE